MKIYRSMAFFDKTSLNPFFEAFHNYPELNISQVAKQAGINSSLLQQYVSGSKTPSKERIQIIENSLHRLGQELCNISLVDKYGDK